MKIKIKSQGCAAWAIMLFWAMMPICWVVNLVKLMGCDFDAPYKEEFVHAIGLFCFPLSMVTAWM